MLIPPVLYLIELLVYFLLYNSSCDAIAEEDENEVDSALLANGVGPGGDLTTMSEERKAAALRIIRRAKRAGLARDRAYSTSEGGTNNHLPNLLNGVGGTLGGPHNRQQRNGDKNSRKSRSGFGRGLPKKGTYARFILFFVKLEISLFTSLIFNFRRRRWQRHLGKTRMRT